MKLLDLLKETDYDNDSGKPFWGNVGVGALLIASDTKRILVGYRSSEVNEPHTWSTFGGAIDDEDELDLEKEVKREVVEETGCSEPIKLYRAYLYKTEGFRFQNFIGEVPSEFRPISLDWENEDFKWVSLEELFELEPKHFGLKSLLSDEKTMKLIEKIIKR